MGVEDVDDLGKICERPRQSVDLVDNDGLNLAGLDVLQKPLERRPLHRPAGKAPIDADGSRMTATHATKEAKRYRYYVSASLLAGDHPQAQKGMRVPAGDIEALVLDRLRAFFSSRTDVSETLAPLDLDGYALDAALRKALKRHDSSDGKNSRSGDRARVRPRNLAPGVMPGVMSEAFASTEVAIPRILFADILRLVSELRPPPAVAST
jgi:hypothetical protein